MWQTLTPRLIVNAITWVSQLLNVLGENARLEVPPDISFDTDLDFTQSVSTDSNSVLETSSPNKASGKRISCLRDTSLTKSSVFISHI